MKKIILIWLVICGVGSIQPINAQGSADKYKALFLYNFTKYMEWPDNEFVTIGVMGNSQVLLELQKIAKTRTKIKLIKLSGSADLDKCNLIFLPEAQSRNFNLVQEGINAKNTIVVVDKGSLTDKGAEIGFYLENSKLKFMINKAKLDETDVKVSQGLYAIAKVI